MTFEVGICNYRYHKIIGMLKNYSFFMFLIKLEYLMHYIINIQELNNYNFIIEHILEKRNLKMTEKKKALALVIPASGHINLMCCLIKELVTKKNFHVILFSVQKYKDLIRKSGAEYREFENSLYIDEWNPNIQFLEIFELIMESIN